MLGCFFMAAAGYVLAAGSSPLGLVRHEGNECRWTAPGDVVQNCVSLSSSDLDDDDDESQPIHPTRQAPVEISNFVTGLWCAASFPRPAVRLHDRRAVSLVGSVVLRV
jgi:hypothetical protein